MAGCGVLAVGVIMQPREWMRVLGITASALELIVGVPLALMTARELGRFSLFALAPIASLILLVMLVWPGVWARLEGSAREKKPVASLVADPA